VCSLIGHVMRALDRLAKKVLSELRVERPAPFVTIQACAKEMAYDQDFAKETGRDIHIYWSDDSEWSSKPTLSEVLRFRDGELVRLLPIDIHRSSENSAWSRIRILASHWAPRSARSGSDLGSAFEDFRETSLSWVESLESHLASEQQERLVKAKLLSDELVSFARWEGCDRDLRFERLCSYVQARHLYKSCAEEPGDNHRDFDGLVLYLAASFRGPFDWLGEDGMSRNAFLVSAVYEALRSSVLGLLSCCYPGEQSRQVSKMRLKESILEALLLQYGLAIKRADIDDLNGCLVRTPFGSSIYVHEELSRDKRERVVLHELGHFLLHGRPNVERPLEASAIQSEQVLEDDPKQEREANGFADLWQHVLEGLVDHVLRTRSRCSSGPKTEDVSGPTTSIYAEPLSAASSQ